VTAAESIDWPDDALDRLATHLTGGALQVADIVIYHDPSHPWKNAHDGHLCLVIREPMPHLDGMATLWDGSLAFALWTSLRRQAQTQPRHRKPAYTERSGR
jgi:hypothetical protein